MKRAGYLKAGNLGTLSWNRGGEQTGWIRFQTYSDSLRLMYRHRRPGGEWQDADEHISFDWTPCNYGGQRPWFLCPHCRRRVGVLYGLDSGFLCRHCYRLPYACQSESRIDRILRKARKLDKAIEPDSGYGKPKGMHWKSFDMLRTKKNRLNDYIDALIGMAFHI